MTDLLGVARELLLRRFIRVRSAEAKARIRGVLANNPVVDLGFIAQEADLSLRRTAILMERMERRGVVMLHKTLTGKTTVRALPEGGPTVLRHN